MRWVNEWNHFKHYQRNSIELNLFDLEESTEYLDCVGIKDHKTQTDIISKSEGLPLLLELLSKAHVNGSEAKWIEAFFNRITQHMTEVQIEWVKRLAFLETRIDIDTIGSMLDMDELEASSVFSWFKHEGSIYSNSRHGWEVNSIVKKLVREKVKLDSKLRTLEYLEKAKLTKDLYEDLDKSLNDTEKNP